MVRLLLFIGVALCYSWPSGKLPASASVKKIFIGVDGVSRDEFRYAQEKLGLFPSLRFSKSHIAPFPSISDYSWNVMVNARGVHGTKGRIRSYEAAHFDREQNELSSDPREYFRRLGEDHHYFSGAFRHWLNPFVESLLYIPTEELPKFELKQLLSDVKGDKRDLVTVMVASSDALAHTRADGNKFLFELDKFISELTEYYEKEKIKVEIILASDHGQAARFFPGEKPLPLIGVNIQEVLRKAGLKNVSRLQERNDVVMPVMALANYGTAFFADEEGRKSFVEKIRGEKWFSLGVYPEELHPEERKLTLFDRKGSSTLTIRKKNGYEYFYQVTDSDPLGISRESHGRWLTDAEARNVTKDLNFPDAFYRLAFSAFEEEAELPDLLFTLHDDYFLAGELNSFTTMYQTHGSLGRRSSEGMLASTHPLKISHDNLRTVEILPAVGITPEEMFGSTEGKKLQAPEGQIATGAEEWDNRRIFSLMNRVVQDSRYVFDGKSLNVVLNVVKPLLERKSPELSSVNWKEAMSLNDVAHLVDLMIRNGNVETIKKDPRFLEIRTRLSDVRKTSERSPSAENHLSHSHELVAKADAAKKVAMKSYSSMFFLEKALTLPEFPFVPDERKHKALTDIKEIFSETFAERTMAKELYPAEFPLLHRPALPESDVTLVYIPGIYNSLFDDEIFRNGLDHLKNKWGMRILTPGVFSTCSSSVNGKIIMDELKRDFHSQKKLGRKTPSYFIMGYSKGGVDSLHGFTLDPDFVTDHVHGLVTIASPIRGSSILNKTDMPLEVMELLGKENAPEICKTEEKASKSINPAGALAFLRKNSQKLVGLTRYYSLSFVSELKSSHLFMRATKNIARFGEPNDGVVALSASRFPDEFKATDLGVVKADHLSGIVASHFPHEAFMESLVFTLTGDQAFDQLANQKMNSRIAYEAKNPDKERHLKYLRKAVGPLVTGVFREKSDLSREIREKLKETPYALKSFSLKMKNDVVHLRYHSGRWPSFFGGSSVPVKDSEELYSFFLSSLQASGRDLLKSNRKVIPESQRVPFSPPVNELGFHEDLRLNLRHLDKFIGGKKVTPVTYVTHPEGFSFVYDHASSGEFRNEFQLSFEECAPADADEHTESGWETVIVDNKVWGKLASTNSSIRLSTYSWRFLASDYPELDLEIQVNDDVEGANVLYGGDGKDDSAFQLWFTFRVVQDGMKREYLHHEEKMMTIGYYFGDEIPGQSLQLNEIYKNYYSEKDFVVAKLPSAKQKLIGIGKDMMGRPLLTKHNLLEDIRNSYPEVDPMKAEIVAITIQHDSNDTKGKSEALFRAMTLKPRLHRTVKAD